MNVVLRFASTYILNYLKGLVARKAMQLAIKKAKLWLAKKSLQSKK